MRKVCVVVASRANYSSIKSVMQSVQAHPGLELQVVVGASALLDKYGYLLDILAKDGFTPAAKVYMLIEGETPTTMAKSTGLGLLELPTVFDTLQPDMVLTVGDRFETMATTLAATYMNIPLAHTMGGEVSGNIDDCIRHAITKFAHIHFPACSDARERIIKLGENPDDVFDFGCPRIDLVAEQLKNDDDVVNSSIFNDGVGGVFDLSQPFLVLSQHPVTSEYGDGERQIAESLKAVQQVNVPTIALWPNSDAGSDDVARGMRKFRENYDDSNIHFFKNLTPEVYISLLKRTACLIGNSSSAIREGAFIGVPAVNIGSRQTGRQRGRNIIDVGYNREEIAGAIQAQLQHGRYESDPIYGDGNAGKRIADTLAGHKLNLVKRMTY